jgi:hypothetical protein
MKKWVIVALFLAFVSAFSCRTVFAQGEMPSNKVDQILQKQDQILAALADIKSELQIVKVRATK